MAKKFSELRAKMPKASQARAARRTREMLKQMPLHELRRARGLSQETLASVLNVRQASVSKIERRTDMYISTLRSHIQAMGGDLEIVARFPDGEVKISNFEDVAVESTAAPNAKTRTAVLEARQTGARYTTDNSLDGVAGKRSGTKRSQKAVR